jgi:hypothetical protein
MTNESGIPLDECIATILEAIKKPNSTQRSWKFKYCNDTLSYPTKLKILKKFGYVLSEPAKFKKLK